MMIADAFPPELIQKPAYPWAERISESQAIEAIENAEKGIGKYLALMKQFEDVDVSSDMKFQVAYKGFYRVRQKSEAWYQDYFGLMQECRSKKPEFAEILEELRLRLGSNRCEASFSSKLVATLNPDRPVWDRYVLQNLGLKWPSRKSDDKHQHAVTLYASMRQNLESFLTTVTAHRWIGLFNERVVGSDRISDMKKLDFILWQVRP
ncbi:MAG: hypothetical protein IPO55_03050 [Alphaproteobacteria bacterium]|nr:hypothetical protein [Alphaproteobacteria bacterium]